MSLSKQLSIWMSGALLCTAMLAGCGTAAQNQANAGGQKSTNQSSPTNESSPTATTDQNKDITIGYIDWSEDTATTYLWKHLLEQKGYNVTLKTVALAPMYIALSGGGADVFFDAWIPEQTPYIHKYKDTVTTLGQWYTGQTQEGLVVPTYMKDVNSMSDLNKVSSQLGGNIVGIDPGNVEMQLTTKAIKQYGLHLNLVSSSSAAMLSSLQQAYQQKQDIAVVLWSPHWAFTTYHLKYLSDPKGVFGKAGYIQDEANVNWTQSHPVATSWLKNFKLTPNQLGTLENDINHASSEDAGVTKWIQDNQSLVNSWFKG